MLGVRQTTHTSKCFNHVENKTERFERWGAGGKKESEWTENFNALWMTWFVIEYCVALK